MPKKYNKRQKRCLEENEEEERCHEEEDSSDSSLEENEEEERPINKKLCLTLSQPNDHLPVKKGKWTNKQRVLVFGSRGMSAENRHLMNDLRKLMPYSRSEPKNNKKDFTSFINEIAEMRNCNKCLYFEAKKKQDLYLWMSNVPKGPSVKFLVLNARSMIEYKLSGNCLKASRPLLSFDKTFEAPHFALIKELLIQTFSTPNHHPRSQPFFDHVFVFSVKDEKIWFRNYQIIEEDGQLTEIGPRFVLNPIKILNGSFEGQTLWSNPKYVTPSVARQRIKMVQSTKYLENKTQKEKLNKKMEKISFLGDPSDDVFET